AGKSTFWNHHRHAHRGWPRPSRCSIKNAAHTHRRQMCAVLCSIQTASLLAGRTIECRAPGLHDAPDGARTSRRDAGLALAVVDAEVMLEVAELAVGLAVVAQ